MTEVDYNFEEIEENVMGAGILPIGIDEDTDQAHLILGKERYVTHWRGSLKWSGFEGGRKQGETVEYTAAREFIEESLDCIPFRCEYEDKDDKIGAIADALRQGVCCRIILCLQPESTTLKRYHVTYLIQVPFNKDYIEDFKARRQQFVDLINKTEQIGRTVEYIDESFPREDSLFNDVMVKAIIRVDHDDMDIVIEFLDDDNMLHTYRLMTSEEALLYCRWFQLRSTFTEDIDSLQLHGTAFREIERNCIGHAVHVRMNDDFVEKQLINWWSCEDLQTVLENGGYINNDYFRAYFLPVLQRTLNELELVRTNNDIVCQPCHQPEDPIR